MYAEYRTKKIYGDKLLDPRWQKRRLEVLSEANYTCKYCGNTKETLHVHHYAYNINGDPWDVPNHALICLCCTCHKLEHFKTLPVPIAEIRDVILTTAVIFQGENQLLNSLVQEISKIILNHYDDGK